jgi:hypothetical protein
LGINAPSDFIIGDIATTTHDYCMLAMTIKDVISESEIGLNFSTHEVINAIRNTGVEEGIELCNKLITSGVYGVNCFI